MDYKEKPTPCDNVLLPVYLTISTSRGIKARKEFFEECRVIALRWYDDRGAMIQAVVRYPGAWDEGGVNFWKPEKQRWAY